MTAPYLIGISGPPRSGKDTLAKAIKAAMELRLGLSVQLVTLSTPMRAAVYGMMGLQYSLEHYEAHKDDPQAILGGSSIRDAMIALSERHVKPHYGKFFWARAAVNSFFPDADIVVITDMGFAVEVEAFERHCGKQRCMWPQLIRPGHDFSRDSRSYVGNPDRSTLLMNDGLNPGFFPAAALQTIDIAERWGWNFG